MRWQFTLIDYTTDPLNPVSTVVQEPKEWVNMKLRVKRDKKWHGVFFEFSLSELIFYGNGYTIIRGVFDSVGINGETHLLIESKCSDTDDWETFYTGRISYHLTTFYQGDVCGAKCTIERSGCLTKLSSRFNQKVNLKASESYDGVALSSYTWLNKYLEIPSKAIRLESDIEIENGYAFSYTDQVSRTTGQLENYFFSFDYIKENVIDLSDTNSIGHTGDTAPAAYDGSGISHAEYRGEYDGVLKVNLNEINSLKCPSNDYDITIDLEGTITEISADSRSYNMWFRLRIIDESDAVVLSHNLTAITGYTPAGGVSNVVNFNINYTGTHTLNEDYRVYVDLWITNYSYSTGTFTSPFQIDVAFTTGHINIVTDSICDPSDARVFMINEALSRATEIITDDCMRVYSDFYGRTDAQPTTSVSDGCGSMECLTTGLFLRNKLLADDTTEADMFVSMKELFDSMAAIHNIGIGVESDPNRSGYERLRVESMEFFYDSNVSVVLNNVREIATATDNDRLYSSIHIGYKKWEAEEYNGLDEFLTKREYRTEQSESEKTLVQHSDFISSGYAIEVTRRVGTSSQDWRYDNDKFIITTERDSGNIIVQQGAITNEANIISPSTILNAKISPVRNLFRWFKYIASGFSQQFATVNKKLLFTSGEGNYIAESEYNGSDSTCTYEDGVAIENQDIDKTDFKASLEAQPILEGTKVRFKHPLSLTDFKTIEASPNELIEINGQFGKIQGWIETMDYEPNNGLASFTLLKAYQ